MRVAVFDTHRFDRAALEAENHGAHELTFLEPRLTQHTAALAQGFPAVCSFVNDRIDQPCLEILQRCGVKLVALRSAGFNHVDLPAAARLGFTVIRVPEYSPHAVAEHAFALLLGLVRRIPWAHARVRDANFALDGLVGFDLAGKTFGVVGTGRIGSTVARIAAGFGCTVLAFDLRSDPDLAAAVPLSFVQISDLYARCDVISLHVPLTPATHHLVDAAALSSMKPGVVLINTGRGALIDSRALIDALKRHHVGGACLDVYEEEEDKFFRDLSDRVLEDDVLARLLTFPNVLVTAHQGFLTREALAAIARTTLDGIATFERGESPAHQVRAPDVIQR